MPSVPGGKCNLYDFGVGVALIGRVPGGQGGRVLDDFVNLMDLVADLPRNRRCQTARRDDRPQSSERPAVRQNRPR